MNGYIYDSFDIFPAIAAGITNEGETVLSCKNYYFIIIK